MGGSEGGLASFAMVRWFIYGVQMGDDNYFYY